MKIEMSVTKQREVIFFEILNGESGTVNTVSLMSSPSALATSFSGSADLMSSPLDTCACGTLVLQTLVLLQL